MIFTFQKWDMFCAQLKQSGYRSIPACQIRPESGNYLVLKHDVETNVSNAYKMAQIEEKYGHRGSYYVQAYLLEASKNVVLLQKMQQMGHEISYHYDVMDSCKGDLDAAIREFENNRRIFEDNGFVIRTVCQHGNPVVERIGYTSNRDFFRSERVRGLYSDMADIMVNYPEKYGTEYLYFSDAGRIFKRIHDPLNNDIVNSDDQNVPYQDINSLFGALSKDVGNIISTHPHRWTNSVCLYMVKNGAFKGVKIVAKLLVKVPVFRKIMSRYYYLAKKI